MNPKDQIALARLGYAIIKGETDDFKKGDLRALYEKYRKEKL